MVNQAVLKAQLAKMPINEANGKQLYVHMFTVAPQVKTFFKGAENMTPEQVPGSDRFKIQGQRLIMALHELVEICGNKALFDCYMRDFMERHKQRGVGADLFDTFFTVVWYSFLEKHGGMSGDEKAAWDDFKNNMFLPAVKAHATGY